MPIAYELYHYPNYPDLTDDSEHTSPVGVTTRLEAFVDILNVSSLENTTDSLD